MRLIWTAFTVFLMASVIMAGEVSASEDEEEAVLQPLGKTVKIYFWLIPMNQRLFETLKMVTITQISCFIKMISAPVAQLDRASDFECNSLSTDYRRAPRKDIEGLVHLPASEASGRMYLSLF